MAQVGVVAGLARQPATGSRVDTAQVAKQIAVAECAQALGRGQQHGAPSSQVRIVASRTMLAVDGRMDAARIRSERGARYLTVTPEAVVLALVSEVHLSEPGDVTDGAAASQDGQVGATSQQGGKPRPVGIVAAGALTHVAHRQLHVGEREDFLPTAVTIAADLPRSSQGSRQVWVAMADQAPVMFHCVP